MPTLGYFPGCSLDRYAAEYDQSLRYVFEKIGIELKELPDWSCCGASAAHHTHHKLNLALNARNINIAAASGLDNIVAPCPACFNRLVSTKMELMENPELREEFRRELGFTVNPALKVYSILELLAGIDKEEFLKKVKVRLDKIKLVVYYGCLLVRPPELINFDDPEDPCLMDDFLKLIGVTVLPWDYKVQCCGATLAISNPEIHTRLSGDIMEMAALAGAEAVAVGCSVCHANLDLKQKQLNRRRKSDFNMPIFYFSQLLGLALGGSPEELGIDKHMVDAMPLLAGLGIK